MTRNITRRRSLVIIGIAASAFALGMPGVRSGEAQSPSPRFGTWRLNTAKSMYSDARRPPQRLLRTDEPSGDAAVKVTYEGVAADGSRIAYSYTAAYDGAENGVSGVGMGNGWDRISLRRINEREWEATMKRQGKVVSVAHVVVSADGKTLTNTSTGTNQSGQPNKNVQVYERQ